MICFNYSFLSAWLLLFYWKLIFDLTGNLCSNITIKIMLLHLIIIYTTISMCIMTNRKSRGSDSHVSSLYHILEIKRPFYLNLTDSVHELLFVVFYEGYIQSKKHCHFKNSKTFKKQMSFFWHSSKDETNGRVLQIVWKINLYQVCKLLF